MTTSVEFENVKGALEGASAADNRTADGGEQILAQAQQPAADPVPVDAGSGQPVQTPQPQTAAPAQPTQAEYVADASNVVHLPANVSIDNIKVDGDNLVLEQADGSVIVIKDAASNVPTFLLGDVEVPRVALIAALEAGGINVAFGADGSISANSGGANSSGGNFELPAGGIGDGFDLSMLLPPTALAFPQYDGEELTIGDRINRAPSIDIAPGVGGGVGTVYEAGLDGRGSDAGAASEFATGTFKLSDPDGLSDLKTLTINGKTVSIADLVGQTFEGQHGILTITGYNPATGVATYQYELTGATIDVPEAVESDRFTLVVSDGKATSAPASITIEIVDDVPVAVDDKPVSVVEGGAEIGGNVMTNDTPGADGARVTSVTIGETEHAIAAEGTTIVETPNGTYTFTSTGAWTFTPVASLNNAEGTSADFTYVITDGDGDTSSATQPITITDGDGPTVSDGGTITLTVDDQKLADGSTPDSTPATGSIIFTPGSDAIASMAFGDTSGLGGGLTWTRVSGTEIIGRDSSGTAVVTLTLERSGSTANVTVTLNDNYHHSDSGDDLADLGSVKVIATDTDGDTAEGTVNVGVSDDVPDAVDDDGVSVVEGGAAIGGNVMDNDTAGADGAVLTHVQLPGGSLVAISDLPETAPGSGIHTTTVAGIGTYTFQSNGAWTFTPVASLNNAEGVGAGFSYVITDGDGDTSSAAQPITITDGDGPKVVGEGLSLTVDDQNLADGSTPGETSADGSIVFTPGSDAIASIVFGDTSGLDGGLTWERVSDTEIVGRDGETVVVTLTLVRNGNTADVTVTLNNNYAHHSDISTDDLANLGAVKVIATDTDGDAAEGTVNVGVSDDVPVAVADTAVSVVEGGAQIGGNVMDNDRPGADGAKVTSVTIGGNEHAVAAEGTTTVTTANGTYTFQSNGAWTFTPVASLNNAEGVGAGFSYVITDGDGDTSSAAQPITITDGDGPKVVGEGLSLTVDDQNLADGSTPGETSADGSIVFTPGSDAIASIVFGDTSGLDGGLTWERVSDTEIVGRDGETVGVTLTLVRNGNTADVTVTLNNNYAHHSDISTDDLANLGAVKVIATDTDGDAAEGTVNVGVSDDVPVAVADTAVSVVEGGAQIGGNVMDNDRPGADGAKVTSVTIGGNEHAVAAEGTTTVTTANGTYTFQSNGAWTFTPVASLNNAEGVGAGFSYVITDGDGDTSSAAQPITITDGDGPKVVGEGLSLTVDDQNLADGSTPGETSADGSIVFTPGSDAIASIVFGDTSGLDGGLTWERVSDTEIVGRDGETVVVTLTLVRNGNTADVTVTLNDNYHHSGSGDDLANLGSVKVIATDTDGDTAEGTVNVGVSDDVPTAGTNATVYLDDETANATNASPNPGGTGDYEGTPPAATTGVLSHNYGADGAGSLLLSGVTLPVSGGFSYVLSPDKLSLTIMQSQGGSNVAVVKVTLADQTSGSYVVEQLKPVMHPTSGTTEENVEFTIRYDVRDGDGDVASGGSVTISVNDDTPTITASNDGREVNVYETDFTVDARVSFASAFTSSYGADGAGSVSYALSFTGPATYLVDTATGKSVILSMEDGQVVGRAGEDGPIVFTISVDGDGYVTVDQSRAIQHPVVTDHHDARPFLSENLLQLTATITDRDGDSRSASINLNNNIYFKDDGPSVSANETVLLDDDALANGNPGGTGDQPDKVNASGTLGHSFGADGAGSITWLTTGNPAPAGFEYRLNGTSLEVWQGATKVLTVTLNSATGAYEVTQNAPIMHAAGGNENDQAFDLTYQVKDGDGDTINGTLKISVNDDTPVANDYTGGNYVEGAGPQDLGVAMTVLGIKPGADGLGSIVFSNTGGTTGTLSIDGAGKLIYTPAANVGPGGKTETFSYTVTDKDGDAVTKQVTFGVTDTGVTNVSATSASVDEDNIAGVGGIPGGPGDLTTPVPSGTISYTLGADGGSGVSVSLSAATVGFTKLDGTAINTFWDGANKVLIGYGGSNQSDVVFKVSLSAIGTLANSANSASYTVELVQPVKHPGHDDPSTPGVTETAFEDDLSISITATVKDGDGSTATTGFTVTIDDDTPVARNDTATVVEGSKPSMNVVLVIDTSGSMDDEDVDPNTPGFQSRLDMAKAAALNLLNSGDVTINQVMVVEFYNGTNVNAPVWGSWSNAADKADIISFINNLYAGGGTSYDAATAAVRASWGAGPTAADLTNVYFLSDGDPDPNSAGLDAAEQAVWQNFLVNPDNNAATNDAIDHVYAVGIGSGVSTGALEPVAWANGNANFPPIVITDATQLSATLQGTLPGNVIGNVLTNDGVAGNAFGADGGYIKSIVIDGVTYTFNGSGAITAGDMSHVISNSGTQIKVSTALGGVLVFNFADNGGNKAGDWGYTAPTSIIGGNKQEGFTYTLIDGDGDTSSATLGITIQDVNGVPTAGTTSGTLDDEGLPHGIAGGINDVPGEAASFSGLLPLNYGSDGAHATDPLSFAAMNGQLGTVGTESVTYSWDNATKTLTAVSATRGAIFKVVIDDLSSGHYAVTLLKPVLHAPGGNENAIDPFVNLTYTVQDLSGDKVNGTLKVTFDDDAPVNFTAQSMRIENGANSAGSGQLHFYESIGADGGSVVFTGTNGSVLKSGSSDVFSGGAQVKLYGFGTDTLVGKIGAAADGSGGTTVFNVKLSPNTGDESSDLYSVQFFKALDDGSGVTITGSNFTDTNARNYKVVDGGASNQDILISASSGSSSTSVNGSNSGGVVSFGAGNPTIGSNETLRFDFASSVQLSGSGANNSFSYGSHYDVNGFSFTVKTGGTSNVLVTVYDADNDSSQGASGLTDDAGSKDTITQIYKNGVLLNLSTLTQSAGGYVVPSNEGDVIAVFTATGYNRAEIAYAAGDVFSVANVGFVKLNTGSNLPLNFNVTATDADGDTATGVIAITTTPPATTLTGTSGDDLLVAGAGGDTLNGQGGNDWLTGGAGADNLNGGSGNDTASYANSTASVRINLDNDGDATTDTASATPSDGQVGGDAFGDNLDSIENLVGGSGDDYLAGNSGQNILMGLGGNDLLFGEGGNDILYGGAGNDTLNGGTGSDTMTGGEGADTFVISADAISGSIDDIITDFNPSQGDVLDLSELLKNISSGTNLETSGYVKIEQSGLDSIVSVDVNGNGDNYQQVAVLKDFTYNSAVSDTIKVLFEDNAGNKHSDNV